MTFLQQVAPDLAIVAHAWPELPDHIKATIRTLINSATVPTDAK